MSSKELAKNLIDQIPESKMYYIIAYLQGAAIPEEVPQCGYTGIDTGTGKWWRHTVYRQYGEFICRTDGGLTMLDVRYSTKFKKDFKTCVKRGCKCNYYNRQSTRSAFLRRCLKK